MPASSSPAASRRSTVASSETWPERRRAGSGRGMRRGRAAAASRAGDGPRGTRGRGATGSSAGSRGTRLVTCAGPASEMGAAARAGPGHRPGEGEWRRLLQGRRLSGVAVTAPRSWVRSRDQTVWADDGRLVRRRRAIPGRLLHGSRLGHLEGLVLPHQSRSTGIAEARGHGHDGATGGADHLGLDGVAELLAALPTEQVALLVVRLAGWAGLRGADGCCTTLVPASAAGGPPGTAAAPCRWPPDRRLAGPVRSPDPR